MVSAVVGLRALSVEKLQALRAECEREIVVRYRARAPEEDLRAVEAVLDRVDERLERAGDERPTIARRQRVAAERRPARGGG